MITVGRQVARDERAPLLRFLLHIVTYWLGLFFLGKLHRCTVRFEHDGASLRCVRLLGHYRDWRLQDHLAFEPDDAGNEATYHEVAEMRSDS